MAGNDINVKNKEQALDLIRRKFPDYNQEQAGSRSSKGWHFDLHPINGSTFDIPHINIYDKELGFRSHITWREQ